MRLIGLLGGTFDPFHNGHLQLAHTLHAQLQCDEVRLIPAGKPALRDPPIATALQRFTMARMAAENMAWLTVDDCEIKRSGTSYTIDTLQQLREKMPQDSLCLTLSMDQFLQFDRWQSWERIPTVAHLIVINRAGYLAQWNATLATLVKKRKTENVQQLRDTAAGYIFFQTMPDVSISGTDIRAGLRAGGNVDAYVPQKIAEYIRGQGLYA